MCTRAINNFVLQCIDSLSPAPDLWCPQDMGAFPGCPRCTQHSWQGSGAAETFTWPAGAASTAAGVDSARGSPTALCASGSCWGPCGALSAPSSSTSSSSSSSPDDSVRTSPKPSPSSVSSSSSSPSSSDRTRVKGQVEHHVKMASV